MKIDKFLRKAAVAVVATIAAGMIIFMSGKDALAGVGEPGKSINTAIPFEDGMIDEWAWTPENGLAANYFSFEMEKDGICDFYFSRGTTKDGSAIKYTAGIYDENAIRVWECEPDDKAGDEWGYEYFVGLKAGKYYLKLSPSAFSNETFLMDLGYGRVNTQKLFEIEPNNVKEKANEVELYKDYEGYYGAEANTYAHKAGDWFCFEGEKNHLYEIDFSKSPFYFANQICLGTENDLRTFTEGDIKLRTDGDVTSIEYIPKEDGKIYFAFEDGNNKKNLYAQKKYFLTVRPQNPMGWKEVNNKKYYFEKESGKTTTAAVTNKMISTDGKWYYLGSDGEMAKGLVMIGNQKRFFDINGVMQTGWVKDGGKWYYLNASGVMQTGWVKDGGKWYYLNASGEMQTGWLKDGGKWYYLNGSGAMQTGWVKVSGKWYYLNGSGAMQTGWLKDGGKWYYLNGSGAMQTGWVKVSGKWYYLNGSGVMQTGWVKDNNKWYYLESSGAMAVNKWISGKYWVGSNGAMATNAWVDGGKYYVDANGCWVPNKKR